MHLINIKGVWISGEGRILTIPNEWNVAVNSSWTTAFSLWVEFSLHFYVLRRFIHIAASPNMKMRRKCSQANSVHHLVRIRFQSLSVSCVTVFITIVRCRVCDILLVNLLPLFHRVALSLFYIFAFVYVTMCHVQYSRNCDRKLYDYDWTLYFLYFTEAGHRTNYIQIQITHK